ncbi:hypothetical protein MY04_5463 [Flammeovirga sp. MY04]|nr:hypothetical protein [Flammeovirga sp. MY04]ANQ52794.1 hypothetical protein MY04_5463 [Flammeovirga sp. MY04]
MKYLIFTLILITTYFPMKAQEVESNYTATFWSNNSIEKINDETLTH